MGVDYPISTKFCVTLYRRKRVDELRGTQTRFGAQRCNNAVMQTNAEMSRGAHPLGATISSSTADGSPLHQCNNGKSSATRGYYLVPWTAIRSTYIQVVRGGLCLLQIISF